MDLSGALIERLRDALSYDPDTGVFRWRVHRGNMPRGSIAGTIRNDGNVIIAFERRWLRADHIALAFVQGRWPQGRVKHENGVRSDCRAVNLREDATVRDAPSKWFAVASVLLPNSDMAALRDVAAMDGVPFAHVVRAACRRYLQERRLDPAMATDD